MPYSERSSYKNSMCYQLSGHKNCQINSDLDDPKPRLSLFPSFRYCGHGQKGDHTNRKSDQKPNLVLQHGNHRYKHPRKVNGRRNQKRISDSTPMRECAVSFVPCDLCKTDGAKCHHRDVGKANCNQYLGSNRTRNIPIEHKKKHTACR